MFYCVLSYIEIDESFHRRGLSSENGKYYNFSYMYLSMNRDLHIKFKGDYSSIPHENVPGLYMLLYGQLILIGDPNINVNVILSIPSGNTTYGTPDDVFDVDDSSTHTFYAEYNWLKTTIEENANFNVSLLTY